MLQINVNVVLLAMVTSLFLLFTEISFYFYKQVSEKVFFSKKAHFCHKSAIKGSHCHKLILFEIIPAHFADPPVKMLNLCESIEHTGPIKLDNF